MNPHKICLLGLRPIQRTIIFGLCSLSKRRDHVYMVSESDDITTADAVLIDTNDEDVVSNWSQLAEILDGTPCIFIGDQPLDKAEYCLKRSVLATDLLPTLDKIIAARRSDSEVSRYLKADDEDPLASPLDAVVKPTDAGNVEPQPSPVEVSTVAETQVDTPPSDPLAPFTIEAEESTAFEQPAAHQGEPATTESAPTGTATASDRLPDAPPTPVEDKAPSWKSVTTSPSPVADAPSASDMKLASIDIDVDALVDGLGDPGAASKLSAAQGSEPQTPSEPTAARQPAPKVADPSPTNPSTAALPSTRPTTTKGDRPTISEQRAWAVTPKASPPTSNQALSRAPTTGAQARSAKLTPAVTAARQAVSDVKPPSRQTPPVERSAANGSASRSVTPAMPVAKEAKPVVTRPAPPETRTAPAPAVPHAQDKPKQPVSHKLQATTERTAAMRILVCDDSKMVWTQMKVCLDGIDAELEFTETAEEALQHCRTRKYSLVFMDVMLPGMDGYHACKAIKTNTVTRHIPVVMLTSKDSPANKVRGVMSGCDYYLTKPVSQQEVSAVVTRLGNSPN